MPPVCKNQGRLICWPWASRTTAVISVLTPQSNPMRRSHRAPVRRWCLGYLDDEIKHGDPASIWAHMFSQSRSQAPTLFEAILHDRWQGEKRWSLAPLPGACFSGKAKEKLGGPGLQIERETITLAEPRTVVSCIGQHADFEQGHGLHLFIGRRKHASGEEDITALLDHILQHDECSLINCKRLVQSGDCLADGTSVLTCRPFVGLGTNEAISENGLNEPKDLLSFGLSA